MAPAAVHLGESMGWKEYRPVEPSKNIVFATFYATGADVTFKESLRPDTKFATQLRRTHPSCKITFMTDQETPLEVGEHVELFRTNIDRSKMGRNPYANYYQFKAQVEYLEKLIADGESASDVVFLDSDILVLDSLVDAFEGREFDYGFTISDAVDMPVNMGIMFVKRGHFRNAINFLKLLMEDYPFDETFTAGQIAIGRRCGIQDIASEVHRIRTEAYEKSYCIKRVHDRYDIQFLPCLKYNFCNCGQSCCTDPERSHWHPKTADDFRAVGLKAVHFVGHRKPCMTVVHDAFMMGGIEAAYAAFAEMPNDEEECAALGRRLKEVEKAGIVMPSVVVIPHIVGPYTTAVKAPASPTSTLDDQDSMCLDSVPLPSSLTKQPPALLSEAVMQQKTLELGAAYTQLMERVLSGELGLGQTAAAN